MSKFKTCTKCGFTATFGRQFILKYQDRCFTAMCGWKLMDAKITEHHHVHCPECGYQVGIQPCNDYEDLKTKEKTNTWSSEVVAVEPLGGGRLRQGIVPPASNVPRASILPASNGWDTTCTGCPMEKTDATT